METISVCELLVAVQIRLCHIPFSLFFHILNRVGRQRVQRQRIASTFCSERSKGHVTINGTSTVACRGEIQKRIRAYRPSAERTTRRNGRTSQKGVAHRNSEDPSQRVVVHIEKPTRRNNSTKRWEAVGRFSAFAGRHRRRNGSIRDERRTIHQRLRQGLQWKEQGCTCLITVISGLGAGSHTWEARLAAG